jgi:hypothetical protein
MIRFGDAIAALTHGVSANKNCLVNLAFMRSSCEAVAFMRRWDLKCGLAISIEDLWEIVKNKVRSPLILHLLTSPSSKGW